MRNPFEDICKADDLESKDIKEIFEKNKIWDRILQPSNHIIIGSRGSGKSMLLKKLSASSMIEEDFPKTHKFFGIYTHISHITRDFNTLFNTIQRSFNDDTIFWNKKLIMMRGIYPLYLSLHLIRRFCEEIEGSSIYSFYPWNDSDKKKRITNDIGSLIGLNGTEGTQEIIRKIDGQIKQIDELLAGEWLSSDEFRAEYNLNIHTLPKMMSNIIHKNTEGLTERMYVYFLLDTSEYIHPECQKVCNSFFERGVPFVTKLAVKPYHLNTLETLSGRNIRQDTEFRVLFLDYLLNDRETSKEFLSVALEKYLRFIKNRYPEYREITLFPDEFLGGKKEKDEILSIFSIASIRDFINLLARAWDVLIIKEGKKIEEGNEIALSSGYLEIALKKFAKIQFDQIGVVEPLDKNIDSGGRYPWEKVKGFYSFLLSFLKKLGQEGKKMEVLTFEIQDLFISEDTQTLLKPAFAEGIFRFCSEEDPHLFSVPNKFYLDPLYLNAPQVEQYKLYKYDGGEYLLKINEEEIRESIKMPFGKRKEEIKELPERYTAFLSCPFEEAPLPKENRNSIKKALKSVKIDVYDAEDYGITFQTVGIREKIKESDLFILELSRPTPNIMFEFGIAAAFEKLSVPFVNKEEDERIWIKTIQSLEPPLTVYDYNLDPKSLEERANQIRRLADTRIQTSGRLYEPLFNKTDVRKLKPKCKKDMIYISYPEMHKSLWNEALDEIGKSLKEYPLITHNRSGLTSFEATRYQVPIYCIWRSKFCIVDTSGKEAPDLFQSYILGLCFGLRKKTLRIEESSTAKKEGISLWSSYPYTTWRDIQNLVDEILKFIKEE